MSVSSATATPASEAMPLLDTSTPVVVLSAKTHGSLGILRSLGRLGIPVYAVDSEPRGIASFSKFCRYRFVWDFDIGDAARAVDYLSGIGRQLGRRAILIPTWDETAIFLAEQHRWLSEWFVCPELSASLARALACKKQMYFLAKRCGIPTPEASFPTGLMDVREFAATASFPVMLKGIDGNRLKRHTGKKMLIIHSRRELLGAYERMQPLDGPNLMLQEYIPGGDDTVWMFNGYFNAESECLLGFTGRKIRQAPVHTGATSLGVCLSNPIVEQTTIRWMKTLGYRGVLDIGYRYDARDGRFKVLDVNPRIGATFRLFVGDNGMDVARALYLDVTGQRVPLSRARLGRKWMVEQDLQSFVQYRREGEITVRNWISSFRGIEEAGYFAWDDWKPFYRLCADSFTGRLTAKSELFGFPKAMVPSACNSVDPRPKGFSEQSKFFPGRMR